MLELNKIYHGDCLEIMKDIDSKSIDMILCDLPYGTTDCKWDNIIPFDILWGFYNRIIKDNGAIVLTAQQPFTSKLVMSNLKMFRYEWIWEKTIGTNFALCKKQPLKKHENILVFYKKQPTYNPIFEAGKAYVDKRQNKIRSIGTWGDKKVMEKKNIINEGTRYPSSIQKVSNGNNKGVHPTQKPVTLFEYLILTYTNAGDLILDNCIGSGTTAIASLNTGRKFLGIEADKRYYDIAVNRVKEIRTNW